MKSINKEFVLVAGAGKGIGFAVVKELLSNYPEIQVIAISRNTNQLTRISKFKNRLHIIKGDLSDSFSLKEIIQKNKLKGLIFSAGALKKFKLGKISKTEFLDIYNNNIWSFINTIQCSLPYLNNSHIVSLGSMGGIMGSLKFPEMSIYSSSKGALSIISECFSEDLKKKNTSVNCLAIGAVNTEMMSQAFPGYHSSIDPEDIAKFICHFTIHSKEIFNGKTIPVSYTSP